MPALPAQQARCNGVLGQNGGRTGRVRQIETGESEGKGESSIFCILISTRVPNPICRRQAVGIQKRRS